ncbi:MAG TPA: ATP-binding protein [Dinghuibacter sp.]|uniref:sensor histidine kinase n=1 Tax=Dinghuibacter sp. TaxID=2024697 RepID=UPI002C7F3F52|nr:ATP-binding protein [Dinghuibacter sp.]HTJ14093.1 ATP-binding protein [Dinghuibacter sp.]
MHEITTVLLDNEMDLILANKQSMRLAELAGLSLSAQTIFATAVSEVSRTALDQRREARLKLCTSLKTDREKFIIAQIADPSGEVTDKQEEGYSNARRLIGELSVTREGVMTHIELRVRMSSSVRMTDKLLEKWRVELNQSSDISPYEEIKRKNKQLVELSDMVSRSEKRYRDLTEALPLLIFTMDAAGAITYGNRWFFSYTGKDLDQVNGSRWASVLHPDDPPFGTLLENADRNVEIQRRIREARSGEYRWHSGFGTPAPGGGWHVYLADIHAQKMVEEALKDNRELKDTQEVLEGKIRELNRSNHQLEQFAYVASHDLQEPLRKIGVYSDLLQQRYGEQLGGEGHVLFENMIRSTLRMKTLIDDVLAYSTISNIPEAFVFVDLNELARDLLAEYELRIQEAQAHIEIDPLPTVWGNAAQLRQLFGNIVSNALKFTRPGEPLQMKIYVDPRGRLVFRDNGIGFDQPHEQKMFGLFQRLHTRDQYPGTGIGLAICKKIVQNHGGVIEAQGHPGEGAEFIVTLPNPR